MNKRSFALLIFSAAACTSLSAQSLVKFPTKEAAWTVEVTYPNAPANPTPERARVQKVEVVSKNGLRRNKMNWSDGHTSESWQLEDLGVQVFEDPTNRGVYVISKNDAMSTFLTAVTFDATFFDWVSPANYKETVQFGGKTCRRYQALVAPKQAPFPGAAATPVNHQAWIDDESGLPVALDNGTSMNRFTFLAAPTEPLAMPEKLILQLKQYREAVTPLPRLKNGRP